MLATDIVVTEELRQQYATKYIRDEHTIQCFEHIKAQSSERLGKVVIGDTWNDAEVAQLADELGHPINPRWIIGQVGEELYMRDVLAEDDWLSLQDKVN